MSTQDKQPDREEDPQEFIPSGDHDLRPDEDLAQEESDTDETPSEVSLRINLLGKLIIPPPHP